MIQVKEVDLILDCSLALCHKEKVVGENLNTPIKDSLDACTNLRKWGKRKTSEM